MRLYRLLSSLYALFYLSLSSEKKKERKARRKEYISLPSLARFIGQVSQTFPSEIH
uniref:Uncharacterized protein n=1 Tax=Picea glauca TaxID=3330 RepID=A0A101M149_PICGL|nr:hypothetical protein ABT39_MTgene4311 [Picea glauca]